MITRTEIVVYTWDDTWSVGTELVGQDMGVLSIITSLMVCMKYLGGILPISRKEDCAYCKQLAVISKKGRVRMSRPQYHATTNIV